MNSGIIAWGERKYSLYSIYLKLICLVLVHAVLYKIIWVIAVFITFFMSLWAIPGVPVYTSGDLVTLNCL